MIASADAVVVGSGAFGASAAYHLARRGARVALLERGHLASQTSPRAAGLTSQIRATPSLTKLARRAVVKLAAFTDETSQPLRFTQSGALKIARTDRDGEQLGREIARGRAAGIEIDWVTIAEARRRLPILGERGIVAIVYVRHERGGLMLGGYEPDPMQVDVDALPESFETADLPLDIEVLRRLAGSVSEQFPIFQDPAIRIAEHRGGLPTLTTDDRYLVGPLPGVPGAWVMSGCCVGGLSASPALGEAMAQWILDGAPALDLSEISTARFAGRELDEAELRERCRRAYATHYRSDPD